MVKQANEDEKTPALTKAECSVFDERAIYYLWAVYVLIFFI